MRITCTFMFITITFFIYFLKTNHIINDETDEKTLKLLKQLDEKLLALNNPEKQQAFIRNQVTLVDKYLKQFTQKITPRNG